jgi:hypothetical protein
MVKLPHRFLRSVSHTRVSSASSPAPLHKARSASNPPTDGFGGRSGATPAARTRRTGHFQVGIIPANVPPVGITETCAQSAPRGGAVAVLGTRGRTNETRATDTGPNVDVVEASAKTTIIATDPD